RARIRKVAATAIWRLPDSGFQGAVANDRLLSAGFACCRTPWLLFREHLQFARAAEVGDGSALAPRSGPRASFAAFAGAGDGERAGVSQARRLLRICRGLGVVFRESRRRVGIAERSILEIRATDLRDVAGGAAGRRYGNALDGLEQGTG